MCPFNLLFDTLLKEVSLLVRVTDLKCDYCSVSIWDLVTGCGCWVPFCIDRCWNRNICTNYANSLASRFPILNKFVVLVVSDAHTATILYIHITFSSLNGWRATATVLRSSWFQSRHSAQSSDCIVISSGFMTFMSVSL